MAQIQARQQLQQKQREDAERVKRECEEGRLASLHQLEHRATQEQSVPGKVQEEVAAKEPEENVIQQKESTVTMPPASISEQQLPRAEQQREQERRDTPKVREEDERKRLYESIIARMKSGEVNTPEEWLQLDFSVIRHFRTYPPLPHMEMYCKERRECFLANHPELVGPIRQAIKTGQVCLKMNHEQVIASIGAPRHVNRTVTSSGTREQWVYEAWFCFCSPGYRPDANRLKAQYLYFENGVLTAWQDSGM